MKHVKFDFSVENKTKKFDTIEVKPNENVILTGKPRKSKKSLSPKILNPVKNLENNSIKS